MYNTFYNSIFLIVNIYFTIKATAYGFYEINTKNNRYGGLCVIIFSIIVSIFTNIIIWTR